MNCTTESAIYVMELSEFHLWVLPLVTWIDGFPQPEYCMLHSLGIKDCGTHRTAACINGNLTLTHRTDFFCVKLEKVKYVGRNSDAEHGIFIFVSDVYEYVYLCGFDGICHGESAAVSI